MHFMLDLETLGTEPGCVVFSFAAIAFNDQGDVVDGVKGRIRVKDSLEAGFVINPKTVEWWDSQGDDAKHELKLAQDGMGMHPMDALYCLSDWMEDTAGGGEIYVWGNGADFDCTILAAYYRQLDIPLPWKYTNQRCHRTLRALYPSINDIPFEGVKHDALDDANHQVRQWKAAMQLHRSKLNSNT